VRAQIGISQKWQFQKRFISALTSESTGLQPSAAADQNYRYFLLPAQPKNGYNILG